MKEIVTERINWVIARFDRKACRFRDGNMLFHGSLWPKWKSLDDLLPTRHKRN